MSDFQFRVSAILDDGGTITTTMNDPNDAANRYEWFLGHTARPVAFVGLFARQPDGSVVVDRVFCSSTMRY